jgi:hypothetical protein
MPGKWKGQPEQTEINQMRGKIMLSENEVKTEDELEQMAKSILGKINLFAGGETWDKQQIVAGGETWYKQQIVVRLVQALYQEQCPNKKTGKYLCYLEESDFMVLGDLQESLSCVRMSDQIEGFYRYLERKGQLDTKRDDGECQDDFDADLPY